MPKKLARVSRLLTEEEERDIMIDEMKNLHTANEEYAFIEKTCQKNQWPLETDKKNLVVRVDIGKAVRKSPFGVLKFWTVWYK